MTAPARTGVLIYAANLAALSAFYAQLLDATVLHADADHQVLQSSDVQLIVHAIPREFAEGIEITSPPAPRMEQAIKPFFTVPDLAAAEALVVRLGGLVVGPMWPAPGLRVRNACDPEGNLVHLRELLA